MNYDLSHIDKYINGQLTAEELSRFEAELASNTTLQDDVATYRDMLSFGRDRVNIASAIKVKDDIHREFTTHTKSDGSHQHNASYSVVKRLIIGLSLLALLWLGYNMLTDSPEEVIEPQVHFAMYFDPDQISLSTRSSDNTAILSDIEQAYNNKDYVSTLDALEALESTSTLSTRQQYIKGIAQLGADQTDTSIITLQSLMTNHPEYTSDVSWFLALAYLRSDDIASCKRSLGLITIDSNKYKQAQELLQVLEGY